MGALSPVRALPRGAKRTAACCGQVQTSDALAKGHIHAYFLQGLPESPPLLLASTERSSSSGPSKPDDITWWTAFTRRKKVASAMDVEVTKESKDSSPSQLPAASSSAKKAKRSRSTAHRVTMTKNVALPSMSQPLEPTIGTPVPPWGAEEPDQHALFMVSRHILRRNNRHRSQDGIYRLETEKTPTKCAEDAPSGSR